MEHSFLHLHHSPLNKKGASALLLLPLLIFFLILTFLTYFIYQNRSLYVARVETTSSAVLGDETQSAVK